MGQTDVDVEAEVAEEVLPGYVHESGTVYASTGLNVKSIDSVIEFLFKTLIKRDFLSEIVEDLENVMNNSKLATRIIAYIVVKTMANCPPDVLVVHSDPARVMRDAVKAHESGKARLTYNMEQNLRRLLDEIDK